MSVILNQVLVRDCPSCLSARPLSEINCENVVNGRECSYPLLDVAPRDQEDRPEPPLDEQDPAPASVRICTNGHVLGEGEQFCLQCGADPADADELSPTDQGEPAAGPTVIDGWTVCERLPGREGEPWEQFLVRRSGEEQEALLTLYCSGAEPDAAVHDVLRRMPIDHVPQLFASGRFDGRAYDVAERIRGGSLSEAGYPAAEPGHLSTLVDELGRALASFGEVGLRHRDLRPDTVLIRDRESFDLVVVGFGSARLSDYDLEAVAPLKLTCYSAPETIVGAVSAASVWWSLGMIVLDQVTRGSCFEGVNNQAFLLHVVTRGMSLSADLEPNVRLLLRGLLARDPLARWSWPQVSAWLAGEHVDAPDEVTGSGDERGPTLSLGGRMFRSPPLYALAALEAGNWTEASQATLRGSVATWLEERGADPKQTAEVRRIVSNDGLGEDVRHALAMMVLNPDLPLALSGEIVTPAWLLSNPDQGFDIATGETSRHLERMRREPWLVRLRTRAEAVRERARLLEIELEDQSFRLASLATSRANLEAELEARRQLFPDTDHLNLASILDRPRLTDEDLVILVCARLSQFTPITPLVEAAVQLASRIGVKLQSEGARALLGRPRREIFADVDERVANFVRCGVEDVDHWADQFRLNRRLPIPEAAVLLGVPPQRWQEPPKQQYVANLLEHLERRVTAAIGRGPLVRFLIGRTTPRVDLTELGTAQRPAESIISHVLGRMQAPLQLDPAVYADSPGLESRIRRFSNHAVMFRRDTGIDGRYIGFPFLVVGDGRGRGARPRIAPVLLWPVAFEFGTGPNASGRAAALAFDESRGEVVLNPALEGILGTAEFARWRSARDDLLARPDLRVADVVDMLGHLATPRTRSLTHVPGRDASALSTGPDLFPAAALFHAEFTGQAVAKDLRQLRRIPIGGTALEAALRISEPQEVGNPLPLREADRYNTVESDPSQDDAVRRSQVGPGLLVEGPPGTGKSQTIVNVVANAIGRAETVLVICQKLAALNVVEKRLRAEGLGDRLFLLSDLSRGRTAVVSALKVQIPAARAWDLGQARSLSTQRQSLAARIEALEGELDRRHAAIHASDATSGLSYRQVVGQLIDIAEGGLTIDAPRLRTFLSEFDAFRIAAAEEKCGPLARDWLQSKYEGSPLSALKPFAVDEHLESAFRDDLQAFLRAEEARANLPADQAGFETEDPARVRDWLTGAEALLQAAFDDVRARLALWLDLFKPGSKGGSLGAALLAKLAELNEVVARVESDRHDDARFAKIAALSDQELESRIEDVTEATTTPNFFQWLSPFRWATVDRANNLAKKLGYEHDSLSALLGTLRLEKEIRPLRRTLRDVQEALRAQGSSAPLAIGDLERETRQLLASLRAVEKASAVVFACPAAELAERTVRQATAAAYDCLRDTFEKACARHDARQRSRAALSVLSGWLQPSWLKQCEAAIARNSPTARLTTPILDALSSLGAYQRVRARMAGLPDDAVQLLSVLRQSESLLASVPAAELDGVTRRSIRREALLAWKGRFETACPELLTGREELEAKVANLVSLDADLRDLNRRVLATCYDRSRLGTQSAWDNLTRIRGPRVKTAREIFEDGQALGLMQLRPIWLMTPDVASRILPLRGSLFDLVVYDEASQMPVEHAAPTLFRAVRAVISGDEKQMPPSMFFSGGIDGGDEDGSEVEELDEYSTEGERDAAEETWNKREVKDCPDLLQLGRWAFPKAMLQIHYRSNYRELIHFSNRAFYGGALSVPVRHPEDEIRRVRPVELVRVDGTYAAQTNQAEAERVVELLANVWVRPATECPSIGVVTFNRKQADLVEDALERRAMADPVFSAALSRERDRREGDEDMGFFVKNVENVQGDERDVIIFSTTFGRDARGVFRRYFGVLGQVGGERRLNVAVTRARSKVILVTSIPISEVSDWVSARRRPERPRDYLQAYLDYATKLDAGEFELVRGISARLGEQLPAQAVRSSWDRDGFRESVASFIRDLGYDPVPADEAGDVFGVDFAIVQASTGLFGVGIECDAPGHDLLRRARAREIWRSYVLRRALPVTHRVSLQDWYHRPQYERGRLQTAVEAALRWKAA